MRIQPWDWQMKTRNDALLSRPDCKSIVFALCVVTAGTGCKQTHEANAKGGEVRESSSPSGEAALPSTQKDSESVQQNQPQREHATEPTNAEGGVPSKSSAAASSADSSVERCIVRTPENPPEPAAAATDCPEAPRGYELNLPTGQVAFVDAPGTPVVDVELALTPKARAGGLMYRTHLAEDAGMLFSWKDERTRSFWMKNTCIPLDMLFIAADGVIVGILEQVPTMNHQPRSIKCAAAHVLEVNAGYTRRHGISPGQKVAIQR